MKQKIDWKILASTLFMFGFFWFVAEESFDNSIIGTFNLIMHEAGHWIFGVFGMFVGILGGSLMQVLVPLVFAVAFWLKRSVLGGVFCLMWAGQNLIEVSVYAGDAVSRSLPLLGGHAVIHDWFWLLNELNLLHRTELISGTIFFTGWLFILGGLVYGIVASLDSEKMKKLTFPPKPPPNA